MERIDYNIYQNRRTSRLAWIILLILLFVFIPIKTNDKARMIVIHQGNSWIEQVNKYNSYLYKGKSKVVRISYLY